MDEKEEDETEEEEDDDGDDGTQGKQCEGAEAGPVIKPYQKVTIGQSFPNKSEGRQHKAAA